MQLRRGASSQNRVILRAGLGAAEYRLYVQQNMTRETWYRRVTALCRKFDWMVVNCELPAKSALPEEPPKLGVEVLDAVTCRTVLANRTLAEMTGFKSPDHMVGISPMDYVLPEDQVWVAREIAEVTADGSSNKKAILRSRTEDRRLIWINARATPFDYAGRPSLLLSLVDITSSTAIVRQGASLLTSGNLTFAELVDGFTVVAVKALRSGSALVAWHLKGYRQKAMKRERSWLEFFRSLPGCLDASVRYPWEEDQIADLLNRD